MNPPAGFLLRATLALAVLAIIAGCGGRGPEPSPPAAAPDAVRLESLRRLAADSRDRLAAGNRSPDLLATLAVAEQALGETPAAVAHLTEAVALEPEHLERRLALAKLLVATGDRDRARDGVAALLRDRPENLAALLLMAELLEQQGDYAGAATAARQAARAAPGSPAVVARFGALLLAWGKQAQREGHYDTALAVLSEGLDRIPDEPNLLLELARTWRAAGKPAIARNFLGALQARFPDRRPILGERAELELEAGNTAAARALVAQLQALPDPGPDDRVHLAAILDRLGDRVAAERLLPAPGTTLSPEGQLRYGRLLLRFGNPDAALAVFRARLAAGDEPEALRRAGELELQRGNLAAAGDDYRRLARLVPGDLEAARLAYRLALERKDLPGGAAILREAVRTTGEPRLTTALLELEQARFPSLAPEALENEWRATVAVLGDRPELRLARAAARYRRDEPASALAELQPLPSDLPGRTVLLVKCLDRLGRPGELATAVAAGLRDFPADPYLNYQQGLLAVRAGDEPAARRAFLAAARPAAGDVAAPAGLWLGHLAARAGEYRAAADYYQRALAAGADAGYQVAWAAACEQAGEAAAAETILRRRVESAPGDERALAALARFYAGRGNHAAARDFWAQLTRLEPGHGKARYYLGLAEYHAGNYAAAVPHFQRAQALEPGLWEAAYALAMTYQRLDDSALALRSARTAAGLAPGKPRVVYLLAKLLRAAGQKREAAALIEPLLAQGEAQPEALLLLGYLYRDEGRLTAAAAALEKYLNLKPGEAEATLLAADVYGELAGASLETGEAAPAREAVRRALRLNPRQPDALLALAELALRAGEWENATRALRDYGTAGGRRSVHGRLGHALAAQGRTDEAMQEYARAAAAGESDTRVYAALGAAAERAGDREAVRNYLDRWVALFPHDHRARQRLAGLKAALGDEGGALQEYQRVLAVEPANRDLYFALGELYARRREYTAALGMFNQALRLDPENVPAHYNLGLIHRQLKDYAAAAAHLERVAALRPDWADGLTLLAQTALDRLDFPRAVAVGEKLLAAAPEDRKTVALMGRVYAGSAAAQAAAGEFEGALRSADAAVGLDPGNADAFLLRGTVRFRLRRYEAAVGDLQEAIKLDPAGSATAHVRLGDVYRARNLTDAAYAEYQRASVVNPGNPEAYARLGTLSMQQGKPDQANEYLQRSLALNSRQAEARLNLGVLAYQRQDYAQAVSELRLVLELAPRQLEGHLNLALAYEKLGRHGEALDTLRRAAALYPAEPRVNFQLGTVLELLNDAPGAAAAYQRALAASPGLGAAQHNLAEIYRQRRQYVEAEAGYRAALADPNFRHPAYAWNGLGLVAVAQQRYEESARAFIEAIKLDAGFVEALLNLAELYRQRGQLSAAEQCAQQALAKNPLADRAWYILAQVAAVRGDRERARASAGKALGLNPGATEYRELLRSLGGN